jgi:1,4-dihydroxy-2-naphthoate octaprenyltransferase
MRNSAPFSEQAAGESRAIRMIKYLLFSASVIPAFAAGAMAYHASSFHILNFMLVLLALFIGQAGADYLYYYFTHFHTDSRDAHTKIFAGWRPLFTGTLLKPQYSLYAGLVCLALDAIIGVYFFLQLGILVVYLALTGGLVAIFFTPLMLRGLKEPVIFLTFGPLCMVSVYYVLTRSFSLDVLVVSLPIGLLVTVVAYLKGARYQVAEEAGEKIVLKLNKNTIAALLALSYATLAGAVMAGMMSVWALLGLLTIPLALRLLHSLSERNRITDYLWATVLALVILDITGLLISAGYVFF